MNFFFTLLFLILYVIFITPLSYILKFFKLFNRSKISDKEKITYWKKYKKKINLNSQL